MNKTLKFIIWLIFSELMVLLLIGTNRYEFISYLAGGFSGVMLCEWGDKDE